MLVVEHQPLIQTTVSYILPRISSLFDYKKHLVQKNTFHWDNPPSRDPPCHPHELYILYTTNRIHGTGIFIYMKTIQLNHMDVGRYFQLPFVPMETPSWDSMGVSLNGGTTKTHPKNGGKPMVVGETHHFKETPHIIPQLHIGIRLPSELPPVGTYVLGVLPQLRSLDHTSVTAEEAGEAMAWYRGRLRSVARGWVLLGDGCCWRGRHVRYDIYKIYTNICIYIFFVYPKYVYIYRESFKKDILIYSQLEG